MIKSFYKNTPEGMSVDHIIPIKHELMCGLNVPWNLQYSSIKDNRSKNNRWDGTYDNKNWHEAKKLKITKEK